MISQNATKIFPIAYLALLISSLVLVYFESSLGFAALIVLSAPWSTVILFFAGWA